MSLTILSPQRRETAMAIRASEQEQVAGPSGVLPVDKPSGITSHDVVDALRRLYGIRRIGHTGTLDPAASGLLLITLGSATRVAAYISAQPKTYAATIRFGAVSDTGDADGDITPVADAVLPDLQRLESLLLGFVGPISLTIPSYAAVRSGGRRRYELARRGEAVPSATRMINVYSLQLLSYVAPDVQVRVRCSAGTYVRSLAAAVGEKAGCGGYLTALRREEIGHCHVRGAFTLETIERLAIEGQTLPQPRPVEEFLDLPEIIVTATGYKRVAHGQGIRPEDIESVQGRFADGDTIALCDSEERIIALGSSLFDSARWPDALEPGAMLFRYKRVLIPSIT
ncbi:MAG: tRNA pseudouridine(55) synthase TruB [Candidatus Zixiibacteriota bacterium]